MTPPLRLSVLLCLSLGACADQIAPVRDPAVACAADTDCADGLFCLDGRCRKSGAARCGDGLVQETEDCDDGNRSNADDCVACRHARCGDGAVQTGVEICDEGAANADDQADQCRSNCQAPRCGDGTVDTGEQCDDGLLNSSEVADRCRVDCTAARCGDGITDSDEGCDDANAETTDACLNDCQAARCGDAIVRTDLSEDDPNFEHCDDGNDDDDDACDRFCGRGFVAVANEGYSTCVALHNGAVWCWGRIANLDRGSAYVTLRPMRISLPGRIVELLAYAGDSTFFGRSDQGEVFRWQNSTAQQVNLGEDRAVRLRDEDHISYIGTESGWIYRFGQRATRGPEQGMIDFVVETDRTYCAITPERQLYCWGDNYFGELGDGSTESSEIPRRVDLDRVMGVIINVGSFGVYTCALDGDRDLHCWGALDESGPTLRPRRMEGMPKLARLAPAYRVDNGLMVTLSMNREGLVSLQEVPGISRPKVLAENNYNNCVIDGTNQLFCKGYDNYGCVGSGKRWRYIAVKVDQLDPVSQVTVGTDHSCARRLADGEVYCWGGNAQYTGNAWQRRGLQPDSGVRNHHPPTWAGPSLALATGSTHSCLIRPDHRLRCWSEAYDATALFSLGTDLQPDQISIGNEHNCAVAAGRVWCWGSNEYGQLGSGDVQGSSPPAPVQGPTAVVELSAGGDHTCARTEAGVLWCWGDNRYGQLGVSGIETGWIAAEVPLPFAIAQVSAGQSHTCVRTAGGSVHCWGGQGNPTGWPEQRDIDHQVIQPRNGNFAAVPGITDASWIASSTDYACAVVGEGQVKCWAGEGKLTTGSRFYQPPRPNPILGLPPVVHVDAGAWVACATTASGEVWCWGNDHGSQLGQGYMGNRFSSYTLVDRLDQTFHEVE